MKKLITKLLLVSMLAVLCAACAKKEAELDMNKVFTGDAVTANQNEAESVLSEAEKGWEEYAEKAEKDARADGSKAPGEGYLRDKEEEVVRLVNAERAKAGLGALAIDETMMAGAEIRASEQKQMFSHSRPDGRSCFSIFDDLQIPWMCTGENVGMGWSTSAPEIVASWMASEGHRANILGGQFTRIGVGCYTSGGTVYWAQLFAN